MRRSDGSEDSGSDKAVSPFSVLSFLSLVLRLQDIEFRASLSKVAKCRGQVAFALKDKANRKDRCARALPPNLRGVGWETT